jgi:hypothetical protein
MRYVQPYHQRHSHAQADDRRSNARRRDVGEVRLGRGQAEDDQRKISGQNPNQVTAEHIAGCCLHPLGVNEDHKGSRTQGWEQERLLCERGDRGHDPDRDG